MLQPLTTLVAPLYLGFLLFHGHGRAIAILLLWWFLSRTIKIMPHLRQNWTNIRVLPWYIFFNYWSAVMKIYAFFTMNQQGWITRWSRSGKVSAFSMWMQTMPSYTATALTVGLVALFINAIHQLPAHAATATQEKPSAASTTSVAMQAQVGGATVSFDPAEWQQFLAPSKVTQCKSDPIAIQSNNGRTPVEVLKPVVVQQTSPASLVTMGESHQLCVLTGGASGQCSAYALVSPPVVWEATAGEETSLLPEWLSLEKRWFAVTGDNDAAQFCFFSDPVTAQCTGYSVAVPPSWHSWWRTSPLPTALQQLQERVQILGGSVQANEPVPPSSQQQLCILEGANEGACQPYNLR